LYQVRLSPSIISNELTKAITGGSEDVLLDLGVREAIKISNLAAKNAKL
jgi:hypothetical protein